MYWGGSGFRVSSGGDGGSSGGNFVFTGIDLRSRFKTDLTQIRVQNALILSSYFNIFSREPFEPSSPEVFAILFCRLFIPISLISTSPKCFKISCFWPKTSFGLQTLQNKGFSQCCVSAQMERVFKYISSLSLQGLPLHGFCLKHRQNKMFFHTF